MSDDTQNAVDSSVEETSENSPGFVVEDTTGKKEYGGHNVLRASDKDGHILELTERPSRFPTYENVRTAAAIQIRTGVTKTGSSITSYRMRTPGYRPLGSNYESNDLDTNGMVMAFIGGQRMSPKETQKAIVQGVGLQSPDDGVVTNIPITRGLRDAIAAIPDSALAKEPQNHFVPQD